MHCTDLNLPACQQASWHAVDRLHAPAVQPETAGMGGRALRGARPGGALSFKWMEVLWRQALLHHPNPAVRSFGEPCWELAPPVSADPARFVHQTRSWLLCRWAVLQACTLAKACFSEMLQLTWI